MRHAFILKFQEPCPLELSDVATCATKTATFANKEKSDADASRATLAKVVPDRRMATLTCTDVKAEQTDSDPTRQGPVTVPKPSTKPGSQRQGDGKSELGVLMATQTKTAVAREQSDSDQKRRQLGSLAPVRVTSSHLKPSGQAKIRMATQTATKAKGESSDQDPKVNSFRIVPRVADPNIKR